MGTGRGFAVVPDGPVIPGAIPLSGGEGASWHSLRGYRRAKFSSNFRPQR
jgi:hypothetical protein